MAHKGQISLFPFLLEYDNPKVKTHSHCALNLSAYQQLQKQTMSTDRKDVHRISNTTGHY